MKSQRSLILESKLLRFLKANPDSTAQEIWEATGLGVVGWRFIHQHKGPDGIIRWKINQQKWDKWVNTNS